MPPTFITTITREKFFFTASTIAASSLERQKSPSAKILAESSVIRRSSSHMFLFSVSITLFLSQPSPEKRQREMIAVSV